MLKHGDFFGYHNIRFQDGLNRTYLMFEADDTANDMWLFSTYIIHELTGILHPQGLVRYNKDFFAQLCVRPQNGLRRISVKEIKKKHKQKPCKISNNNVISCKDFKSKKVKK